MSVTLKVYEGKPVYVRKVKIKGNYETRDYVIRRELRVQEQEIILKKGIKRSQSRILNLGYYEDVQIQPFPAGEDKWDLLVKIRERFTGQFSVGLSYNEITKLSAFVSLKKGNFLGTGDIVGLSVSYGAQYKDNSISYTDKWFLNRPVEGSYTSLSYTVAVPILGGTEKFHKVVMTGSKFIKDTYFDTGFVFSSKVTVGFVEPYGGEEVPLDERFFVGGDFTIRGYDYGMAGVVDQNNDPIGSTKELILNFELNYKLHQMLYAIL